MANNLYTTKTAALKATKADVSKLNVKTIKVNGKDVATSVKHPNDTREVITENDLWGSWAEIKDGEIIFHEDEVTSPNYGSAWNTSITKVEDNKAYTKLYTRAAVEKPTDATNPGYNPDTLFANVQTEKIKNGKYMFEGCSNLTTFTSDLSSLTDGSGMFQNCPKLTTFTSDLSSLTCGYQMFVRTKLTPQSVMYIVDSIKDINAEKKLYQDGTIPYVTLANGEYSSTKGFMSDGTYVYTYNNPHPYTDRISASSVGTLTIGINVTNDANTIADQLQAFAEETACDSWEDLKQEFVNKGWTVTWQYGGTTTSIAYGLRDGEQIIPCPIFAKLVESDEDSAEYCSEDASSFYNIEWGHDVTNYDDFQQFDSLEDAMASWNVFPKENIITTVEEES